MIRGMKVVPVDEYQGYDTFTDAQEVTPSVWVDSLNVVITPNGNALPLRSPANFNTALSTGNKVLSNAEYDRTAGARIVFDINLTSGTNVATYMTTGGANTQVRTGQADASFQSLNVNNCLYRTNGTEFIQYVT